MMGFLQIKPSAGLHGGGDECIQWAVNKSKEIDLRLSEIILSDEKKKTDSPEYIARKTNDLADIIRDNLMDNSELFRKDIQRGLDKKLGRETLLNIKMPGRESYSKELEDYLVDVSDDAQKSVLRELNRKTLANIKDLPKKTRNRLLAEIALLVASHYTDLEKISYFFLNQRIDNIDDVIDELQRIQVEEINKPKYDVAALNAVSGAVNGVRNDVFQTPEVMEDIESFVFVNPDPKSPICQHLAGRVFSKEEYATSPYLPPLHHNCKSTVRAQTKGDKDNLPLSNDGLKVTAKGEDADKIMKSKTFTECC